MLQTLLISSLPLLACGCGSSAPDGAPQVLTAFYDHIAAQEFSVACGLLDADTAARLSSQRLSCPDLFSAGYQDLIVGAVHIDPSLVVTLPTTTSIPSQAVTWSRHPSHDQTVQLVQRHGQWGITSGVGGVCAIQQDGRPLPGCPVAGSG